nr:reverse transcriptase domain-containing protein [Tanacetum cinerariifolium]
MGQFGQITHTHTARIAQSSALPPIADEPASLLRDVSQGEACPTVSSLDAEQDMANITKTSTLPHESTSWVPSLAVDEGCLQLRIQELTNLWRRLDEEEEAAEKGSNDTEEMINVLTSMDAATILSSGIAEVPTGSGSIPTAGPPGTGVPTSSDVVLTASLIFATATVHLDREDLNQLWRLMKESLSIRSTASDKEIELWVELKRLYEPDVKDQLWTHTQNLMHALVEWKLYDRYGVHHVTSKYKEICMLVEKDYPLEKGLAIGMISYKLQGMIVGNKMHKAFPLPVMEFPLSEEVPTTSEESFHCQKKRDATAKKIALLLKSSSNYQSKSYDSYAKLVPHVSPCILGITVVDPIINSFNILNDFEMATEGNSDPPVSDLRTMKELCQPSLNGRGDDANKYRDKFLHVTQIIKVNGVTDDALRLYLFPHSLTIHPTAWFDHLPRNSINTFEQMAKMFLGKYFPPSMVTKLRNEITNSVNVPMNTFYNGLTLRHRDTVNAAAGGTFMKRRPEESYDLIENITAHHNDWATSAQRSESSSSITSSSDPKILALKAKMAKINKNLMKVLQINQQVKAVTPSCETYGGPHSYNDCLASISQTQNVYAVGAYQVERETVVTKDTVPPTNNRSTIDVQPPVVQVETPVQILSPLLLPLLSPLLLPFVDALILMPKFGPTIMSLLTNKEKLFKLARTSLNEYCSVVLLKKFLKKLGYPGKLLIPCDFPGMDECLALADLGTNKNLMPLFVWNKLSVLELNPTLMTLELADRSISRPIGVVEDVLIGKALINVYEGELTLRVGKEAITFNLDQTSRYSANYNDMTANRIDVIGMACEEYSQEVLSLSDVIEVNAFLALEDDPTTSEVDQSYYDTEGDILLLKAFLNDDPSLPLPIKEFICLKFERNLKFVKLKMINLQLISVPRLECRGKSHSHKGFEVTQEKSHFMVKEGIVLGHKISKNGIEVDKAKVDVIAKLPHPTTVNGAENLAADHLSRLENPHQSVLDKKEINETFTLETLNMVSFRGNSSTPRIFDVWGIDFMRPFPSSQGNKYILEAVNYFSKWVEARALPTNEARVVCKFLKSLFARFRTPRAIISDRGTHFYNDQFTKVMLKYGVTHRLAIAYHPQISGQVEVSNRSLKRILERTVDENRASWSDKLDDALWAFRIAFKTPIGCTPYKLVYGKVCLLPIELEHKACWALKHANFGFQTAGDHHKVQLKELNELRDQAYENTLICKEKTKRIHDSKVKDCVFNVGNRVLLFNSILKIFSGKLKTRWSGPFTIT